MTVTLGIPKEYLEGEKRVSFVPEEIPKLQTLGIDVVIETGAGYGSYFTDDMYRNAGATVIYQREQIFRDSDIIVTVQYPKIDDISEMKNGSLLIGLLLPDRNRELIQAAESRGVITFSMDMLPRTSRAQVMDVLTSQSSIAGYVGAVIGAANSSKLMPMLTTAAGTVKPSKVLVLGAGVAGLMAIATSRRLGAVVTAYDVRKAAKEEVKSLGARFLDLGIEATSTGGYARELTPDESETQQKMLVAAMTGFDLIITTASVPGKKAPVLITKETVELLTPGTLIVDLSADSGGNCELTRSGDEVSHHGVTIIGVSNPPSHMPVNSSEMFSRNLAAFIQLIVKDGAIGMPFEDELLIECMVSGNNRRETDGS